MTTFAIPRHRTITWVFTAWAVLLLAGWSAGRQSQLLASACENEDRRPSASTRLSAEWKLAASLLDAEKKSHAQENSLLAPHSLAMLMRVLRSGSEGNTASQMDRLFPAVLETEDRPKAGQPLSVPPKQEFTLGVETAANGGYGLLVRKVVSEPASTAFHVNDLILTVNDRPTRTQGDLQNALELSREKPGSVKIQIYEFGTGQLRDFEMTPQPKTVSGTRPSATVHENRFILAQHSLILKPEFASQAEARFNAHLIPVDFLNPGPTTLEPMSKLFPATLAPSAERLASLIKSDAETRLMLLSFLHFQSPWVEPFAAPEPGVFQDEAGETRPAEFFGGVRRVLHSTTNHFDVAEIPYAQAGTSFVLLLPRKQGPIPPLTDQDISEIGQALNSLVSSRVRLRLPAFRFGGEHALETELQALGLEDAFSDRARFSGITAGESLKLGAVTQITEIDFNAAGTTASAVTRMNVRTLSGDDDDLPTLDANHPFLFLILNREAGTVLFAGRVENP